MSVSATVCLTRVDVILSTASLEAVGMVSNCEMASVSWDALCSIFDFRGSREAKRFVPELSQLSRASRRTLSNLRKWVILRSLKTDV